MPFKLRIQSVDHRRGEVVISGRLVEGAYFGPEEVSVPGVCGRVLRAWVECHSLRSPVGWPVLPEHPTELALTIRAPDEPFKVDRNGVVIGHGVLFNNTQRVDITAEVLGDPRFWALELGLHLASDDVDEPEKHYFDVSNDELDDYYEATIHRHQASGVWPFLVTPLDRSRYLEIEFAAYVEHQTRYWLGDYSSGQRVCIGYHSGHFSLPAFRPDEIAWLLTVLPSDQMQIAALLLPATYDHNLSPLLQEAVPKLVKQLPGLQPATSAQLADVLQQGLVVEGCHWTQRDDLGWTTNWPYSQRNPGGSMSALNPPDFEFIRRFFVSPVV